MVVREMGEKTLLKISERERKTAITLENVVKFENICNMKREKARKEGYNKKSLSYITNHETFSKTSAYMNIYESMGKIILNTKSERKTAMSLKKVENLTAVVKKFIKI